MQRRCPLPAAFFGGLLLVSLLSSCGGSKGESSASNATPAPTSASVLALDRFHYVASLTLREKRTGRNDDKTVVISTEGDFQQPDRHAFTYTIRSGEGALARSAVVIGYQAWMRTGDQPWQGVQITDPQLGDLLATAFTSIRPQFLGGSEYEQVLQSVRRLPSTPEDVNGVSADHYKVGLEGQDFLRSFLANDEFFRNVSDLSWELWLARDGAWPARLLATATVNDALPALEALGLHAPTSWELRIEVSRPNDPTLIVAPPS